MDVMLWILFVVLAILGSYRVLKYAQAGYPRSLRWRLSLFLIGGGISLVTSLLFNDEWNLGTIGIVLGLFVLCGFLFAWFLPIGLSYTYPRRFK